MPLHLAARSLLAKADFFVGEKWQVHSISWGLQSIDMQSNIQSYPTNRSHSKSYTVWFLGIHRMSIESPWYNCKWFFIVFLFKTLRVLIAAQGFFQERGLNIWRSGYLKSVISRRFFGRRIWKIIWFAEEANESLVPVRNLTNVNWRGTISKGKAGLPSCIFWRGFSLLVFGGGYILEVGSVAWTCVLFTSTEGGHRHVASKLCEMNAPINATTMDWRECDHTSGGLESRIHGCS